MAGEDITIGRIGPARGVRGELFVQPWTDVPDERFAAGSVIRTEPAEAGPLTVATMSSAGGKTVIHFVGVDDRAAAEALRGVNLVIGADERPPLHDPDEFYDSDLIGLSVQTVEGLVVGPITDVLHSVADSLLVIATDGREVLVPFRKEFVPVVDLAAGLVQIDPPEGLLEL
jgi:16S rRNA processing protein RimM